MTGLTQSFIEALHHLEETGDADRIVALFADDATISNPLVEHRPGEDRPARHFWQSYRAAFKTIRSEFSHVLEGDGVAILEWVSKGHTGTGPFRYGGVSVLECGPDRVTAFRSYFDPARIAGPVPNPRES